jgi:glycosidase
VRAQFVPTLPNLALFAELALLPLPPAQPSYSWQRPAPDYLNANVANPIELDGTYDFPMIGSIQEVFGTSGDATLIVHNHTAAAAAYQHPENLAASVDNYFDAMFISTVTTGDATARLQLAVTFLMTIDRVPFLYSGDEYAIQYSTPDTLFGADPSVTLDASVLAGTQALIALRAGHDELRRGALSWLDTSATFLSYTRTLGSVTTIVVLNIDASATSKTIALSGVTCGAVTNILTPSDTTSTITANSSLSVTLAAFEGKVLGCSP